MANADPPNEVDNRKSPSRGDIDSPDAHAPKEEVRDGVGEEQYRQERNRQPEEPRFGVPLLAERHRGDGIGDRADVLLPLDEGFVASRYERVGRHLAQAPFG